MTRVPGPGRVSLRPGQVRLRAVRGGDAGDGARPGVRFNDGTVDPFGSFWAGTLREMAAGFTVSNGIGWSPDSRTMYFTYTRRVFAEVSADIGGMTIDADGFLWSAEWDVWRVTRATHRPVSLSVGCACQSPTSPTALSREWSWTGYIMSARPMLSDEDLAVQPLAGDLFCLKTDVMGRREHRFGGRSRRTTGPFDPVKSNENVAGGGVSG